MVLLSVFSVLAATLSASCYFLALRRIRCVSHLRRADQIAGILRTSQDAIVRRHRKHLSVVRGRAWIDAEKPWPLPHTTRTIGARFPRDGCPVTLFGNFARLDDELAAAGIVWPRSSLLVVGDPDLVLARVIQQSTRTAATAVVTFCVAATFCVLLVL